MSQAASKQTATPSVELSIDDMKKLKSLHRPRFTDAQVKAALKYLLDHPNCTLDEAGKTQGMSGQTLAKRRDELAESMGLGTEAPKAAPQQTAKAAKSGSKK